MATKKKADPKAASRQALRLQARTQVLMLYSHLEVVGKSLRVLSQVLATQDVTLVGARETVAEALSRFDTLVIETDAVLDRIEPLPPEAR